MKLLPEQIWNPEEGHSTSIANMGYVPGVYFLMDWDGDVLYIGQSKCVAGRIHDHFKKGEIPFSKVAWIEFAIGDLLAEEAKLISKYQPHFNDLYFRMCYLREVERVAL